MNKENTISDLFVDFIPVFGSGKAYCQSIDSLTLHWQLNADSIDCNRSLDPKNERETREQEGNWHDW